ncbi:MAG: MraY family glycosyltransferase [bacterium]
MKYKLRLSIYVFFGLLGIVFFLPQTGVGEFFYQINQWWICILIRSFILAFLLCPLVEIFGTKYKFLDYPDQRKIHETPIPRIGGMAIYLTFIVMVVRYIPFYNELIALLIGASIIYLIGMLDDMRGLPAFVKLGGQLMASSVLIYSGITIDFVPHMPGEKLIEILITYIWLIGITNAINFLDGINGLCSGIGIMCSLLFLVLSWGLRQGGVALATVVLAGACFGFLPYNFKFWREERRASLFLGDEGSTLIGFILASVAAIGSWAENNTVVALSTPLLILGIPIFDMIYTTISRVKNGLVHSVKEWLDFVGKDHFHHRLVNLGFKQKGAVLFILSLNLCLGLSAVIIPMAGSAGAVLLLCQALIIFLIIVKLMLLGKNNSN